MSRQLQIWFLITLGGLTFGCNQQTSTTPSSSPANSPSLTAVAPLVIQPADSPAAGDSREPELSTTPDGGIIMSWVEKSGARRYLLRASKRTETGWSRPFTVAEGDNWFVNWADFPSVIVLPNGSLAAHWLVKSGKGTYAYDVNISQSTDDGKTWTKPIVPHSDKTETEHGFVSLLALADGRVGAVWLDGRNMKDATKEGDHAPTQASMTLRYAAIDANGQLSNEAQLDERVCECCQTSAALTSEGIVAVYRDRSENEIRDISVIRQQGEGWSAPKLINADNWEISGCPVNGPSISAAGQRVAVAWFTAADDQPKVKVSFSSDAGATFSGPIEVDSGNVVGRVDVLMINDGSAVVCWLGGTAEKGELKVRRLFPDGRSAPPVVIAETSISRSSGFPRMARIGNDVYFAWTEFGEPSRVRTATARVAQ